MQLSPFVNDTSSLILVSQQNTRTMADDNTICVSPLSASDNEAWEVACSQGEIQAPLDQFLEITDLLLERVQLNSTHLFRADILRDTSGKLQTLAEKEANYETTWRAGERDTSVKDVSEDASKEFSGPQPPTFKGFELDRTVIRRLIPRKPQLDAPLEQSCFIYHNTAPSPASSTNNSRRKEALVVYIPHCASSDTMPWYHPKVRGLAYLYISLTDHTKTNLATLSIHYFPFPDTPTPRPDRLIRTFASLLKTTIRLLKLPSRTPLTKSLHESSHHSKGTILTTNSLCDHPLTPTSLKDTLLPQHTVQNTYTRLKQTHAASLIARWIEKTEPSKHVFEDLSIAAFLIELWASMYGSKEAFNQSAGFVDVACGNGVLVYVLIKEGWRGWGFDARRRKTWDVLGDEVGGCLKEMVCVPRPFGEADKGAVEDVGVDVHDGVFEPGTFIISNHADELTCWTPVLAALSCLAAPLPFLAIPCCSHALDGSRRRYTTKEIAASLGVSKWTGEDESKQNGDDDDEEEDQQPIEGDLKAMRAAKQKANAHSDDKSMYACLTRKTAALAQELGMDVELTLIRIPSTRNIGIVGNRKRVYEAEGGKQDLRAGMNGLALEDDAEDKAEKVQALLVRECAVTGGIDVSARTWIEKAKKLNGGQGRGKVNLQGRVENGHG